MDRPKIAREHCRRDLRNGTYSYTLIRVGDGFALADLYITVSGARIGPIPGTHQSGYTTEGDAHADARRLADLGWPE